MNVLFVVAQKGCQAEQLGVEGTGQVGQVVGGIAIPEQPKEHVVFNKGRYIASQSER